MLLHGQNTDSLINDGFVEFVLTWHRLSTNIRVDKKIEKLSSREKETGMLISKCANAGRAGHKEESKRETMGNTESSTWDISAFSASAWMVPVHRSPHSLGFMSLSRLWANTSRDRANTLTWFYWNKWNGWCLLKTAYYALQLTAQKEGSQTETSYIEHFIRSKWRKITHP